MFVLALQLIEHGADKNRTGRANRMAQRHCAAIDVDAFAVNVEVANELLSDDRESLIDFKQVNIGNRQTGFFENLFGGRNRCIEHQSRAVTHIGDGLHFGARFQAIGFGIIFGGQQQSGCAIDNAG